MHQRERPFPIKSATFMPLQSRLDEDDIDQLPLAFFSHTLFCPFPAHRILAKSSKANQKSEFTFKVNQPINNNAAFLAALLRGHASF